MFAQVEIEITFLVRFEAYRIPVCHFRFVENINASFTIKAEMLVLRLWP